MTRPTLAEQVAVAARELQAVVGATDTLDKAVSLAVEIVGNAQDAAISLIHRSGEIDTAAATGPAARRIDELQYEHREGPCLDAIRVQEVVHSADVGHDDRWPRWGPAAADETGVRSMLCFQLFTHEDTMGALNLFSRQTGAFDDHDREEGLAVAAQAAIAVAAARKIEQLRVAIDSRNIIGQAQGVIMASYDIDAHAAFSVLARLSSHSNRKLREVAAEIAEVRRLPERSDS